MPFQQSHQPGVFGTEFCQFFGAGKNTRVLSGLRHTPIYDATRSHSA